MSDKMESQSHYFMVTTRGNFNYDDETNSYVLGLP